MALACAISAALGVAPVALAGNPFDDPRFVAEVRRAEEEREKRERERQSPAARERRGRSRTEYRRLDRAAAIALAQRKFGAVAAAPPLGGVQHLGTRARGFIDDHTALVDNGDGQRPGLMSSLLPLRVERDGEKLPISLGLQRRGDVFVSETPLVPTRFGVRPGAALELTSSGLRIGLAVARESQGLLDSDRVFFTDVASDTDAWLMPTVLGAEIFWQLRSPESPEALALDLGLPTGAEARLTHAPRPVNGPSDDIGDRWVEIRRGERILAVIQAPAAFDAAGTELDASYELSGSRLTVHVKHRDDDVEYPILVDPPVEDVYGFGDTNFTGGWGYESNKGDHFWWDYYFDADGWRHGLHMGQHGGHFWYGEYGGWYLWAPGQTSYIYGADMEGVHHEEPEPPETTQNFYSGLSEPGRWQSLVDQAYDFRWHYRGHCANGASWQEEWNNNWPNGPWNCPANPVGHNKLSFGAWIRDTGWRTTQGHLMVRDARVYMSDPEAPAVSLSNGPSVAWRKDFSPTVDVSASDPGLGVQKLYVVRADTGGVLASYGPGSGSCGGRYERCSASGTWTLGFSTRSLPEGITRLRGRASDPVGQAANSASDFGVYIDRSSPQVVVSGDARTAVQNDQSGRDLYELVVRATDGVPNGAPNQRRSGVDRIRVLVDGALEAEEFTDASCGPDSCPLTLEGDDFVLDTDWLAEGPHSMRVEVYDKAGNPPFVEQWNIEVAGPTHYAAKLTAWRADAERRVDEQLPLVPLTRQMPAPPDDWRNVSACGSSEAAMRGCYDNVRNWGTDVRRWLEENLPAGQGAGDLPDTPIFEWSQEDGVARDLTRRMRDTFAFARRSAAEPTASLNVALGFHGPLSKQDVTTLFGPVSLQPGLALTGAFDPGGADLQGTGSRGGAGFLTDGLEQFYAKQADIAQNDIAELEQEQPADTEEAEDIQAALGEARAFKQELDARGPFVKGIALRLSVPQLTTLLDLPESEIKAVRLLEDTADLNVVGGEALETMTTNRGAVMNAARLRGEPVTSAARSSATASSTPREPTCDQRGEAGRVPRRVLDPNPVYWAPSRHKADTVLGDKDGDFHLKVHRLRFRWQAEFGLAWMCADKAGERNVEIEARVYPNEDERWSDNWESQHAGKYTQHNLPEGAIHQDDIASGRGGAWPPDSPTDKAKYPDFAILAQASRAFRYRKLYRINFTTNEGDEDAGATDNGVVIYSGQATRRARSDLPKDSDYKETDYCNLRNDDYKACMFGTATVCYNYASIAQPAEYRRVDWANILGYNSRISRTPAKERDPKEPVQVTTFCDPKPPGADSE